MALVDDWSLYDTSAPVATYTIPAASSSSGGSLLDSSKGWADTLGGLAGKYLDFRRVQSQDAINASQAKYQVDAAAAKAAAAAGSPAWVMPALLVGGAIVVVLMLRRG